MSDVKHTGQEYEEAACESARDAGEVLRKRYRECGPIAVEWKGLHDFVTEVDREAEQVILAKLEKRFPEHAIMSEEASPDAERNDHRWIIDPLDGTTNFVHGVPTFGVSIALEDRDGLLAGAIYDPLRDEMYSTHRGGGARMNHETIRCSEPVGPQESLIATGFPFRELSRVKQYLEAFEAFIRSTAGLRRAGSASLDLAYTACGRYDGFWELGLSRWDIAAGILLVKEAGGVVTDMLGGDTYLESGDVVAGGPRLHETLLEVTREKFG